ncbi:MAG: sulfite exporter TauE/SafE family protein [Gammaproteobacteria bacterium]|nr:sulfite exporter TauE/SafE family protein [Gammaproteobacteria bacterium]MBU1443456.1 sulfite exporter TauE/SafE family protein [Gammaproteobacteria bacterium]MBU2285633.1 sulfite exporter TauE/SafE family protein [Gammaproteobacteria bacterium]MBU2409754.1 sulfite exporter TauE/SafE family protein [Gammaproteobacteria bacterium]
MLVAAGLIVTLAYGVYGLTGFGASMVAIPLLAQFFPLRFAVPMMLLFDLGAGLLLGLRNHRLVDRGELLRLAPWLLVGMFAGITLLVRADERWLLLLLGAFVLINSAWSLSKHRAPHRSAPRGWAAPAGLVGGAFTALYGTGGPIYTIYLARRLADKTVLRASIGVLIFCTAIVRLALFTGSGFYHQAGLLVLAASLLPCALVGYFLGSGLHARLPSQRVMQAVWVLLMIGGAGLVLRAFRS